MRRAVRNRPRRPWACLRLARSALAAHWSESVLPPRLGRLHGDVVRVFHDVGIVIIEPLRIASYLFGHLDGMTDTGTLCEVAPELPTEDRAFVTGIGRLVDQLRTLWGTRGNGKATMRWSHVGAVASGFSRNSACMRGRNRTGEPTSMSPFTADTIPAGSAQVDLLRARWVAIGADGYL